MERVLVNKIIPFSSVDGPGNRTAIFLQGCNINCKYCHNPETRAVCIGCGLCAAECPAGALTMGTRENPEEPVCSQDGRAKARDGGISGVLPVIWDPEKCCGCDTCIHVCPHDASPRVKEMTAPEVMEKVRRQIPFIRGISVSGGECMLHPQFLTELFGLAQEEGLTTLIDSNGTILCSDQPELMAVTNGVMLDIKAFAPEDFRKVADADNANVLANALWLGERGKLEEVRFVIVPDLYDTVRSVRSAGEYLKKVYAMHPFRIKLIAYRPMGVRGEFSHYEVPDESFLKELREILAAQGYENIVLI